MRLAAMESWRVCPQQVLLAGAEVTWPPYRPADPDAPEEDETEEDPFP